MKQQLIILLALWSFEAEAGNPLRSFATMTNVLCISNSPLIVSFDQCQIESADNEKKLVILGNVREPVVEVQLRVQCFRKQYNGYVPFVIDFFIDWCDFIKKRNNEILNRMFNVIERSSNVGTKCPFVPRYVYVNLTLNENGSFHLPFKFPAGEYRLDIAINANRTIKLGVNAFVLIDF